MMKLFFEDGAGWFTAPAAVGTVVFVARLLMATLGGHIGHSDVHFDAHDSGHSDSNSVFKVLSIQSIGAFIMGFGWGGLAALHGAGMNWTESSVVGLVCGAAMLWLLTVTLRAVYRLHASGNIQISQAVGSEGVVYANVPGRLENETAFGKVRLVIGGRPRLFNAVSESEAIPTNSRVRVVRANADNTLSVKRLEPGPAAP